MGFYMVNTKKIIVFDVDGVLLDYVSSFDRYVFEVLEKYASTYKTLSPLLINGGINKRAYCLEKRYESLLALFYDSEQELRNLLSFFIDVFVSNKKQQEKYKKTCKSFPSIVPIFKDVFEKSLNVYSIDPYMEAINLVKKIAKTHNVAIVSNRMSDALKEHLSMYFDNNIHYYKKHDTYIYEVADEIVIIDDNINDLLLWQTSTPPYIESKLILIDNGHDWGSEKAFIKKRKITIVQRNKLNQELKL